MGKECSVCGASSERRGSYRCPFGYRRCGLRESQFWKNRRKGRLGRYRRPRESGIVRMSWGGRRLIRERAMAFTTVFVLFTLAHAIWRGDNNVPRTTDYLDSRGGVAITVVDMVDAAEYGENRQIESEKISPVFSPTVQYWADDIVRWADMYNLDPDAVATIMQIESCGDPLAVSSAGARGLFQVMPDHFEGGEDMLDPETNARRGLGFFASMLERYNGDVYLAFAAYNGGPGNADRSYVDWPPETQRYYVWTSGILGDAKAGLLESPTLLQWYAAGGQSLCDQAAERQKRWSQE